MNEDQIKVWTEEQHKVASKVIIRPNEDVKIIEQDSTISNDSFCSLPIQSNQRLGGVDVSFGPNNSAVAVYVVMQGQKVLYVDQLMYELTIPYLSSYLAFREIEPLTQLVLKQMEIHPELNPEVILVDGNGILHERRAGIASFLGVRTGLKTIGVAKSLYCMDGINKDEVMATLERTVYTFSQCQSFDKSHADNPSSSGKVIFCTKPIESKSRSIQMDEEAQSTYIERNILPLSETISKSLGKFYGMGIPLRGQSGDVLAAVLVGHGGRHASKKKVGTKVPVFISIGHNISLQEAIQICAGVSWAKIPEPVRQADLLGRDLIRRLET